jgi:hypothetical protein
MTERDLLQRVWDSLASWKEVYPENWLNEDEVLMSDLLKHLQDKEEDRMTDPRYTQTTHEMACFYLEAGMYTIKDLEELLADFKIAKEIQDRHLKNAMGEIK